MWQHSDPQPRSAVDCARRPLPKRRPLLLQSLARRVDRRGQLNATLSPPHWPCYLQHFVRTSPRQDLQTLCSATPSASGGRAQGQRRPASPAGRIHRTCGPYGTLWRGRRAARAGDGRRNRLCGSRRRAARAGDGRRNGLCGSTWGLEAPELRRNRLCGSTWGLEAPELRRNTPVGYPIVRPIEAS